MSRLCPQPAGNSFDNGAPVVQVGCDTTSAFQRWRVDAASGSTRRMKNTATGLCLDAQGGAVNETPVVQWTCNSISNERWERPPLDGRLISRVSGTRTHCLDVPFSQSTPGLQVWIHGCNGTLAQSWDMNDVTIVDP